MAGSTQEPSSESAVCDGEQAADHRSKNDQGQSHAPAQKLGQSDLADEQSAAVRSPGRTKREMEDGQKQREKRSLPIHQLVLKYLPKLTRSSQELPKSLAYQG